MKPLTICVSLYRQYTLQYLAVMHWPHLSNFLPDLPQQLQTSKLYLSPQLASLNGFPMRGQSVSKLVPCKPGWLQSLLCLLFQSSRWHSLVQYTMTLHPQHFRRPSPVLPQWPQDAGLYFSCDESKFSAMTCGSYDLSSHLGFFLEKKSDKKINVIYGMRSTLLAS